MQNNMDNELITLGGALVPNPNYRKGNGQPEYIRSVNTNYAPSTVERSMQKAASDTYVIRNPLASKLLDYDIVPTEKIDREDSYRSLLADAQSNFSKATNALGQTLVSEVGIGTFKGVSDLMDSVGQLVGLSDGNYSNPVSQFLEEKQEEFRNWAPVYSDPNKTIANGGLTDFGWWASNFPSIASSLALLIPAMGVTRTLSAIGKIGKLGQYTNRATRAVINPMLRVIGRNGLTSAETAMHFENGLTAALSRTMENYQEARQTYNDTYADMATSLRDMSDSDYNAFLMRNADYLKDAEVDINNRDEVAKTIAKSAADRTFQLDWANVIFDTYQIYGLRNMLSHAPKFMGNAATRRAQREVIRTAGMTPEKAAETALKDSKFTKLTDYAVGYGRAVKAQLSEGVEEAVNYIAQQEGTHLGKYILTGEDDGPMTKRILTDYVNDGSLWDSAFWGVLGGVVFQAGGNKLNQIRQTIDNRQNAKKSTNKDDDTTKEAKVTPHWWQLDNLNETERMLGEINGRNQKLEMFRASMKLINDGKNTYIKKENGEFQEISSLVEGRALRDKTYNEYLDNLFIEARNNGTLDMLKAYIQDKNVRNAVVAAYKEGDTNNTISQQEAEAAATNAIARINKLDNLYQNEIIHVYDVVDKMADKKGITIPVEYAQIIASANVRHKLNLEAYDNIAAIYKEDTKRITDTLGDKFDSTLDYQSLVSLRTTIQELSRLEAERKELEKKQKEKPTISRQFELDELNSQIKAIKQKAFDVSTDAGFARAYYATMAANSAVKEYAPDGTASIKTSDVDLIASMDENITKTFGEMLKDFGSNQRDVSTDAVIGELRKINNDVRYILPVANNANQSEDASYYLDNLDPNLRDNYELLSIIELNKIKELEQIAETEEEISNYVGAINNVENVARRAAIEEAVATLQNIQRAHPNVDITKVVNTAYESTDSANYLVDTNGLSEEERTDLNNALKILNVADIKNRDLLGQVVATLTLSKATQKQVEANNKANTEKEDSSASDSSSNTTQSSSTLSTSPQATIKNPLNTSSTEPQTASRQAENGQIEQNNANNVPRQIVLNYGSNGEIKAVESKTSDTEKDIPTRELDNGYTELSFTTKNGNVRPNDISNTELFEIQHTPMDGGVVTKNPVVKIGTDGKVEVISKGLVQNPAVSNVRQDVVNQVINELSNDETLKSRLGSVNNETKTNAVNELQNRYGLTDDEVNQVISGLNVATSISSTGELESDKPEPQPSAPVIGADPGEYLPAIATIARQVGTEIKNGNNVTYNDFIARLESIRKVIDNNNVFNAAAKNAWDNVMRRLATNYPTAVDAVLNTLQSSTTEELPNSKLGYRFKTSFKKEVEKLVKAYLKDVNQTPINGKYVISLENLLRYCNGEFQNNENAELLYTVLSHYLKSEEAADKYQVVETNSEIYDKDFLDKVKTPLKERAEQAIKDENHRINTIEVLDKSVFDEIEVGQPLTTRKEKNRIYFDFNGKNVGYIGIPKVSEDGTLSSPYKHWFITITPEGKDIYTSKLASLFKSIINAEDGDLKEIRDVALSGKGDLSNNKTWKAIKSNTDYVINTSDFEDGVNDKKLDEELLGVINTMASFVVRYGSANAAIDGWFNALAQEYIAASELANNPNREVVVDAITDGSLIRATDRLTDGNRNIIQSEVDKLPLASKAIGSNYKGRVSIGVGSRDRRSITSVVKKENDRVTIPASVSAPGIGYSNTFVVFPIGRDKTNFAQAYPLKEKDFTKGSEASKIVTAFVEEVDKYFERIANNPNDKNIFRELQDFLFKSMSYKGSTTPLFKMDNCEKVSSNYDERGTHLGSNGRQGPRLDFHIFCNTGKQHAVQINRKTSIDITPANLKTISDKFKQFLSETLSFNIAENYIVSDNNTRNQVTGLATRDKDGKFVVKIGDNTFSFDSYNDFILNNDLVRVNTKPNKNGNNVTRTSSNPNIRYRIVTSSPVEEIVQEPQATNINTRANEIITSDRIDKASALAGLVVSEDTLNKLSKYGLLPINLAYDENFNTGEGRKFINASFNRRTKITSIGPRFISMLTNPNEQMRKQAVRKLVHERLHDIIHSNGNEHYIQDIKSIYEQFVEAIDNEEFSKPILEKYIKNKKINISLDKYFGDFKKYKYLSKENETDRLEEFLVDSLTSVELANYLNNVTGLSKVNMRERKRDTLLNKIMRVLAKLLGVNIKSDSLYAKEFEALRRAMDTTVEGTLQFEEETIDTNQEISTQQQVEETTETNPDVQQLNLLDNSYDDDDYSSTTEEYEDVASISDYIQSYSPEDRAEVAKEIKTGELSIKCK